MRHSIRVLTTLALLAAGAPAGAQVQPRTPPPGEPESGRVVLACVVNATGDGVKDCVVESEDPPGYGFGPAAVGIASQFKLAAGKTAPGSAIRIPIRFPKEAKKPSTVQGSPPSAPQKAGP
jgi:hypothetical protein